MDLLAHLAELDARRLYLGAGFSSTFTYCTQVLRLSEGGAYNRIEAARAARKYPLVLDLLERGAVHLTSVRLLAPHLTDENHGDLLAAATHRSRRQVEELLAQRFPKPDVLSSVRKLPAVTSAKRRFAPEPPSSVSAAAFDGASGDFAGPLAAAPRDGLRPVPPPAPPAARERVVTPLASDRYQIRFTASASTCEKLRRAQDLLRHAVPDGDPAEVFDRALTALLGDLERRKFAATKRPRASRGQPPDSRSIPAKVRRAVRARDGDRCAYVADNGRRCQERGFLEFHHVVPYARGGQPAVGNIQLRCRAHNRYEAELCFGPWKPGGGEAVVKERVAPYGALTDGPTRPETSWRQLSVEAPVLPILPLPPVDRVPELGSA